MVNIPLIGMMDDFGMLEPTDVGNMTVDYDLKEDNKKKQRWDQDETVYMLQLIKENNLVNRYSMTKMSNILSELMLKKGYHRSDRQISQKLMSLRKNFLNYQQQKIYNPYGYTKECPFYKELHDIYSKVNNDNDDDDLYEATDSTDGYLIKFPNDNVGWQKSEVQKMLNSIKTMKLKSELTLTFFSPMATKMIAESMQNAGYKRSAEQVKNALINLRTMYVNYKIACDRNENPRDCIFLPTLELFWNKEYRKCRLKRSSLLKIDDSWSVEETIVLLTLIKDLDIAKEAYKNTNGAAEDLRVSLGENGYSRTTQQIKDKLSELKTNFLNVHKLYANTDAVHEFHFYTVYKKLFEHQFTEDLNLSKDFQTNTQDYLGFCNGINDSPCDKNEVVYWTKDEVKLLLKTVREMKSRSMLSNSLENEKLQRLREILKESGYRKTTDQIKHKLTLLKHLYMKCNLDDSSEKDIFDCPFYNELHDIFQTPVSDERYEFIQNLLSENLDLYESKFSDHSYTNTKFANSGESRSNGKVTVIPNKCLDTWFPVESIIDDDDDVIGASSTLNHFNDLNGISNKEQEQIIDDAFLAKIPNNSDTKIEINPVIPDTIFSDSKNTSLEDNMPPIIDDIALDQEVTAVNEEPGYSRIFRYRPTEPEDADSQSSSVTTTKRASSLDDEVQPPLKKPRIVDDERITDKNKFLLKPVDSMNPSSLNVMNSKFVRLIVANEPNKNRVNHITAHIEPLNVNTANSVSSGTSSPVEQTDILKLTTERALSKEDFDMHRFDSESDVSKKLSGNIESKISETIKEAVQTMMKNNEFLQEKHHLWMEKQFEIQRKYDEARNNVIVNELKQLRNLMTVLVEKKSFDMYRQSQ